MPAVTATPLIGASDLKRQRGWTEGLIGALLGAPDALAPNPHGFRPPMRLFMQDRVLAAEAEAPFVRWTEGLDARRAWRRAQPTRVRLPTEIPHLEWLDDPHRIALFLAPRVPRRPRRRRPDPEPVQADAVVRYPQAPFEILTLF